MGPGWSKTRKKEKVLASRDLMDGVPKHGGSGRGPEAPGMAMLRERKDKYRVGELSA